MRYGKRHGLWKTRLYHIWQGMKRRCEYPKEANYSNYGGRGIRVCDEWHDSCNFFEWALANGYADTLSIDRIDYNGDYCPENCRWVDMVAQGRNRSNNRIVEYNGERRCLSEWSEIFRIPIPTLWHRLEKGMSAQEALTTPPNPKFSHVSKPVIVEWNGQRHTKKEWEKITGIPKEVIRNRLRRGWTVERALTTPTLRR